MLVNATPHKIMMYDEKDTQYVEKVRKLIVKPGAVPYLTIEPSGILLNAKKEEVDLPGIAYGHCTGDGRCYCDGNGCPEVIPVKTVAYESDKLPDDGNTYIVSAQYGLNIVNPEDKKRVYMVGGTVYADEHDPKPIGCTYLIAA